MNKQNIKFDEIIKLDNLKTKFGIINIIAESNDIISISKRLDSFSLKTVVTIKKKSNINTISGRAAVEIAGSFLFLPFENFDIVTFLLDRSILLFHYSFRVYLTYSRYFRLI